MLPVIPLCIVEEPRGAFSSGGFPATSDGAAGDPQSYPNFRLWPCIMAMMMMINNAIYYTPHQSDPTTAKNASFRAKMCLLGV